MTQLQSVAPGLGGAKALSALVPIVPSDPTIETEHQRWLGKVPWIEGDFRLSGESTQHGQFAGRESIRPVNDGTNEFLPPTFPVFPPIPPPPDLPDFPDFPPRTDSSQSIPTAPSSPFSPPETPGSPGGGGNSSPWIPSDTPPWVPSTPDTPPTPTTPVAIDPSSGSEEHDQFTIVTESYGSLVTLPEFDGFGAGFGPGFQ